MRDSIIHDFDLSDEEIDKLNYILRTDEDDEDK